MTLAETDKIRLQVGIEPWQIDRDFDLLIGLSDVDAGHQHGGDVGNGQATRKVVKQAVDLALQ